MRVQAMDGAVFEAEDDAGLVRAMCDRSFEEPRSVAHFRALTATRVKQMTGRGVRASNDADFVADLVALGFLKPLDAPDAAEPPAGEREGA